MLHIFPGEERQFFIATGLYAGYLMYAQEQIISSPSRSLRIKHRKTDLKDSLVDTLNHFDIGVSMGLGYQFKMGIIIKVIGDIGLRDILDVYEIENKFITATYSLGYNFGVLF